VLRRLLFGVVAILALAGASLIALYAVTRDRRPGRDPLVEVAPAPAPAAPWTGAASPSSPPSSNLPAGLLGQGVPVMVEREPPRPPPPPGSWEAVPVAARPGALGPLGAALGRELNDLHDQLAACFDEDSQARHGVQPVSQAAGESQDDVGGAVLILQLEASSGQVRVVDAPVEARGGASDGLIACAQRVLRGKVFEAPTDRQSGRFRLLLTLTP